MNKTRLLIFMFVGVLLLLPSMGFATTITIPLGHIQYFYYNASGEEELIYEGSYTGSITYSDALQAFQQIQIAFLDDPLPMFNFSSTEGVTNIYSSNGFFYLEWSNGGDSLAFAIDQSNSSKHSLDMKLYDAGGGGSYSKLINAVAPVPIPGAVWLLGTGLLGLVGLGRKR